MKIWIWVEQICHLCFDPPHKPPLPIIYYHWFLQVTELATLLFQSAKS